MKTCILFSANERTQIISLRKHARGVPLRTASVIVLGGWSVASDVISEEIIGALTERNLEMENQIKKLRNETSHKETNYKGKTATRTPSSNHKSFYLQSLDKKIDIYKQELSNKKKLMEDNSPMLFEELAEEQATLQNKKKKLITKIQEGRKNKALLEQNIKLFKRYGNYQFV